MADIQPDAFPRAAFGKVEQVLVFHDAGARLAVEAVGHDIAGAENFQNLVVKGRWLAHMYHHRHFQDLGDLLAELDRRHTPGAGDDMARPHLQADYMLAVFRVTFEDTVEIDVLDVAQFRHPVAGNETDGAEVEEGLDALP